MTSSILAPVLTARERERDRSLAAVVALTTWCDFGGAVRSHQGYLRRDWLLFVGTEPAAPLPRDADIMARDLKCDLVVAEMTAADQVPVLRAGVRLWSRLLWRGGLQLWRDDTGGRCCLVPKVDIDLHLWLESGRVVAREGLPWRDASDRDLGFARAAAAFRRLMREG